VEAGIALPGHGYGVDKVQEMLSGKRLAPLAREVKATAVLAALEAAGVPIRDIVQDAVQRDNALDAFEAAKEKELAEIRARNAARVDSLQAELKALSQKISGEVESLQKQSDEAAAAFAALRQRKQQEEQRLFEVVSHFIEGGDNPVTAPGVAPARPGSPSPAKE
jgi:Skp family chaperone for outer membrane proteins